MKYINSNNLNFTVLSTTLCGKYDEWKTNQKVMDVLNMNTNSLCIYIKIEYPKTEDKVIQSMALSFLINLYLLVCGIPFNCDNVDNVDNNMDNVDNVDNVDNIDNMYNMDNMNNIDYDKVD